MSPGKTENITYLIEGCKANDRKSQEKLYQRFYHPMLALCFRYTKNQEDAIEVLHEGLLKVFQHIHQFDESKSALFTWVHTIMVRSAIDFLRKKNTRIVNVDWNGQSEPAIQAEALLDKPADEIMQFLQQLPEITAAVFNLHVIEGYKHKEIAAMLKMSEGTSKWHLSVAKKELTTILEKKARA